MTETADRVGLSRNPTNVALPEGVKLDEELGQYGGQGSIFVRRLFEQAALLTPGRSIARNWTIVEKMRRHYQVSACLTAQALAEARAEWSIECDDDDVREWLTEAYGIIAHDVQRTSARALWAGFSPNTLVYSYSADLGGIVISELRDLEPRTCTALVDDAGSYAGFVQSVPGATDETIDTVEATLWIVEAMESGNLYGRSVLEAAYDPFADHAAIRAFHARYLERFGEPVVKTRAPAGQSVANTRVIALAVARGEPPPAAVMVDNVDTAREIGESLRNHSVVAFPADALVGPDGKSLGWKWDAEYLEASRSGGSDFLDALRETDRRIARGIFIPDLLFTNTETGAYSLGKSHRDVWTESVEGRLDDRGRQQSAQIVDRLRRVNFGESAPVARLSYAPLVSEDTEHLWEIVAKLLEGRPDLVEWGSLLTRVGLPVNTDAAPPGPAPPPPTFDGERIVIELAKTATDVAGLPDWKLPQAFDPPAYRRTPNDRERRVAFARIEQGLNETEAATIDRLVALLERERDRVNRQVAGAIRKATPAEILSALGTIEVKGQADVARAWRELMSDVFGLGLDTLREELTAYASKIPSSIGAAGGALIGSYASSAAERVLGQIVTEVRFELLNAYTSSVAPAGLSSIVADVFAGYEAGEGKAVRLTTRHLSAKALNVARRDGIERGGIPLRGAQYSALLDRRTCDLCEGLDEQVIPATHTDLARFTPPVHHNCRCVWIWITEDEEDFSPTWASPSPSLVDRFGGLVI